MTVKELSQLYWLKKEIEHDRRRLAALEAQAASPRSPNLDGMPRGTAYGDGMAALLDDIADLQALIDAKIRLCVLERKRLERYIADIEDSQTRQVFTLRYVECCSWAQVADEIGGGNTEDSVKKRCYRHLRAMRG